MNVPTEALYLKALQAIGRLADEHLTRRSADDVMWLIGLELERLGVTIDRTRHADRTDIRH